MGKRDIHVLTTGTFHSVKWERALFQFLTISQCQHVILPLIPSFFLPFFLSFFHRCKSCHGDRTKSRNVFCIYDSTHKKYLERLYKTKFAESDALNNMYFSFFLNQKPHKRILGSASKCTILKIAKAVKNLWTLVEQKFFEMMSFLLILIKKGWSLILGTRKVPKWF